MSGKLGETSGQVILEINSLTINASVDQWAKSEVTTTMPSLGLAKPVPGKLYVLRADGSVAQAVDVRVLPADPAEGDQ